MAIIQKIDRPYIETLRSNRGEVAIFGYQIPYLPDFLLDHTLLGDRPAERLDESLSRLAQLVIGLRKFEHSAYALRYISDPARGAIDIYWLGRVGPVAGAAGQAETKIAPDLEKHLTAHGLPFQALDKAALTHVRQPFPGSPPMVEVRQRERVERLIAATTNPNERVEVYTVHPYWGPRGSCLEPFEVMLRQQAPVALSVYLEPTQVSPQEELSLATTAQRAQTLSDFNRNVYSEQGISRARDPKADQVARIYAAYSRALDEPFILLLHVASPDLQVVWNVARAYTTACLAQLQAQKPADETSLPSGVDFHFPDQAHTYQLARQNFDNLVWQPWGNSPAESGKERLPYLAGAHAATTVFRFPISVKGGVPGIAVRQPPPDFEPGARPDEPDTNEIHLGDHYRGGAAVVSLKSLTRHSLITGFTGSGKTNTVIYLLWQLWKKHRIPFLVIESAKKEYRSLLQVDGFADLRIFTLGDESVSPFRLNPFELLPGVRLEAHLGRLQSCFDAALPQFGILPSIIAEALERIYKEKGWQLMDRGPLLSTDQNSQKLYPTLQTLLKTVIQVAEQRGYAGETYHNIRAAAAGRIGNLLRGSRGRMFGAQRSFPADEIFKRPVILEMNDLNEDDKALTMMFLLTWLREYRELHPSQDLQHVTVIEEAHNVVSNVQSVGNQEIAADTRAKAVAAFANMLSEVRAYGEGLIISDQSPEKLAPDALRNTNLQIAHQLRDRHDRDAVARAMIMDEEQRDYLGKLRIGEAALFVTGLEKATFIRVPEFKDTAGFNYPPSDTRVAEWMAQFHKKNLKTVLPFDGCRFCSRPCDFLETIQPCTYDQELHEQLVQALKRFDDRPEPAAWPDHWREIAGVCHQAAALAGLPGDIDAAYCYFAHEITFPFTEHMRRAFIEGMRTIG